MNFIKKNPLEVFLVAVYLLATLAIGIYALTCNSELCSLILVIPLTPWPQLDGVLPFSLPRYLLPLGVVINSLLLFYVGRIIRKLFNA
ncbi:MAG: hypothetical protein WDZ88_03945 [Candidatus Paceibacterota bacterium]